MKEENSQALGLGSSYWVFRHGPCWISSSDLIYFQYKSEGGNQHGLEIFVLINDTLSAEYMPANCVERFPTNLKQLGPRSTGPTFRV
jgi:hypothetical protein